MPILDRTPLNSSDKLHLLADSASCQVHGQISALSQHYGVSRKTIYQTRKRAQTALNALVNEQPEQAVITTVGVTVAQLQRTIVALAITAPNSIRAIEQQIPLLYPGCRISYGSIQAILIKAQQQAEAFNLTVSLAAIKNVALDEMFSQGSPVLAGIDLDSGFLFSLSHERHRDGDTWATLLKQAQAQKMQPAVVVKDGAKGIANGVSQAFPDCEQRDDAFHALYITGKAVRKTERRAYYWIGREEEKHRLANRVGATPEDYQAWAADSDRCADTISEYEAAAQAMRTLHAALGSICRQTGALMTESMAQTKLQKAVELLQKAHHPECDKAATYLNNRLQGLTLATVALHQHLLECAVQHPLEQVELACRLFEAKRELKKAPAWKIKRLAQEMLGSYHLLRTLAGVESTDLLVKKVDALLQHRHRASSAIEGFNATLRSYLYVRKGVNQGFLELFKAWYNLRERRWGKHRGTSAYELLTGQKVSDWLTLLGFPPSPVLH